MKVIEENKQVLEMEDDIIEDIDPSSLINPSTIKGVISSKSLPQWRDENKLINFPGRITKSLIPINLSFYKMMVAVEVEPNVRVETHAHKDPLFRYFTAGSAKVNGILYQAGDWIIIGGGTPYEIETETGYSALVSYGDVCGAPHSEIVKKLK